MKEYDIDHNSFIGGSYIPEDVCDQIIDFWNKNESLQVPGIVGNSGEISNDDKVKKCTQMNVQPFPRELSLYELHLQETLNNYIKKYKWADFVNTYQVIEKLSIQHYKPGEGFYKWHTENTGYSYNLNRHLVFMTYLNDVENAGTEFYYFPDLNIQAKKGLTLIWPAGWTHTHRGVISDIDEKHIITGWFNFYDQ